ncbi:HNH endonuclease signature motif containing protein [Actinomycetospora sp. CA-084318]|uniref:HNH endonuclease signature motif containing protein n=1 Tax=Actinomycetospora sp. CA-084318 TaxID=3239892 RepID=UPI003D995CE2
MALPGRERVTLTVTLDYETLRQQLADTSTALALLGDSTWIRPDTARRLACDADLIPMVLGSKGEVLDVGRKTRAIPTATGRAVVRRDRHCAFPGCAKKARHSEIHHIIHWGNGGHTEPDNLVCLCRYHHDLVHHGGWTVHMLDHLPWFVPPQWIDPTRQPRHNRPWGSVRLTV